jgi:hypothetical protein
MQKDGLLIRGDFASVNELLDLQERQKGGPVQIGVGGSLPGEFSFSAHAAMQMIQIWPALRMKWRSKNP